MRTTLVSVVSETEDHLNLQYLNTAKRFQPENEYGRQRRQVWKFHKNPTLVLLTETITADLLTGSS